MTHVKADIACIIIANQFNSLHIIGSKVDHMTSGNP